MTADIEVLRYQNERKSVAVAYLFLVLLGGLGAHRLYLHKMLGLVIAILNIGGWTLAAGMGSGLGIALLILAWSWVVIDLFLLPGMVRDYNNGLLSKLAVKLQ